MTQQVQTQTVATSRGDWGERVQARRWLVTPEEVQTPTVLRRAWAYARTAPYLANSTAPNWTVLYQLRHAAHTSAVSGCRTEPKRLP